MSSPVAPYLVLLAAVGETQKYEVSWNKDWATLFYLSQNDQILTNTTQIICKKKKYKTFLFCIQFAVSLVISVILVLCLTHHGLGAQWGPRQSGKENLLMSLELYIFSTHFAGPNRCRWISKYRCFDYFQMFPYLNRGRINIHDCKHTLTLTEKTLNTSVHRPMWKCHWKQVIPVIYYLCIYLFIFTFTMIFFF